MEKYEDVADEGVRIFARELLHSCKAAIKDLLEPVGRRDIFATFDSVQIQQAIVAPVHGDDPGPSSHPGRMRA